MKDLSEARRIVEQQRAEIERLRQGRAADTVEIAELETQAAIRNIDDRFCGRLALMLECVILDLPGHFEMACRLLDEYKAEWEKVNPSPPTFMGEPMPPKLSDKRVLALLRFAATTQRELLGEGNE